MKDLTNYSGDELSLVVFNDEYFYTERTNLSFLLALVKEEFIYTDEQLSVLLVDLAQDAEETGIDLKQHTA
mgnify:CR=1 FL=1